MRASEARIQERLATQERFEGERTLPWERRGSALNALPGVVELLNPF